MRSPKVTICIPTYNYGRFIGQAIESALAQDFTDYELLILDNASQDNTEEVVKSYRDPRLQYIKNASNLGFVGNINKGLELARGKYLIYLHADDIWYEGILRKEVQLLDENAAVTVVHTAEKLIDSQGKVIKLNKSPWARLTQGPKAFRDYFRLGWYLSFSSCMMRRSVLTEIGGYDPAFGLLADAGTFLKLCLAGDVAFINECLVGYRLHGESLSDGLLVGGQYFQEQKKLLDIVFSWPATQAKDVQRYKHSILASLALTIVKLSHIAKIERGAGEVVKWLKDAFRMSPRVVLSPVVWIRVPLVFLLPGTTLQWLQEAKRKAALVKSA